MAQATVTLILNNPLNSVASTDTQEAQTLFGTAVLTSGGTYATGGLALTWTGGLPVGTSSGPKFYPQSNQSAPFLAYFQSIAGGGYVYGWNASTGKLQIFTSAASGSPLAELANAATVPTDTISFEAWFKKA